MKFFFVFTCSFLILTGCKTYYVVDTEDVSIQNEYSHLIGARCKLKCGCYLAISTFVDENRPDGNEFERSYYKQTGLKPIKNSDNKPDSAEATSDYFIVPCGMNGAPLELDKKYINKEIRGGKIVALLPQGTEFTIRKIVKVYLDDNPVFINTYIEILSNNIIMANAFLLVRNYPYEFYFKDGYIEMLAPSPQKK
jgi:hypothetical protein